MLTVDMGLYKAAIARVREDFFRRGRHWSRYWTMQVLAAWVERERVSPPRDDT